MAGQTSYQQYFNAAFPGQIGDTGPHRIEAWRNEESSNVPAGIGVAQGTNAGDFELPDGSGEPLVGVILNSFARNPGDAAVSLSGQEAVLAGVTCNLMVEGAVWVATETAFAIGDSVYVRYTTNSGTYQGQLGTFANATDSGKNRVVKGARVLAVAAAPTGTNFGAALIYFSAAVDRGLQL